MQSAREYTPLISTCLGRRRGVYYVYTPKGKGHEKNIDQTR